jgi:RNA-directed DNA polymerase
MKRRSNLFPLIVEPENLRLAFLKAAKGKRDRPAILVFSRNLNNKILQMNRQLMSGDFPVGKFSVFRVYDPKERLIHAAAFPERVMHHAVMNLCEPILEKAAIFDSYACRKGKGRQAAVQRAQWFCKRFRWFAKMDVRKFFDSVSHAVLVDLLCRKFKDPDLMQLFCRILESYETFPGLGLPIGSLTSQHFANYYLAPLDRFLKEELRCTGYVRYMDDFVIWDDDRMRLKVIVKEVRDFLKQRLELSLKSNWIINRTGLGLGFLGYRVFPHEILLNRQSRFRFRRKYRAYEHAYSDGRWSEHKLQKRMTALLAFVQEADTLGFRRAVFFPAVVGRRGAATKGLKPGESGRKLEQQPDQRAVREPQQEHARQPEQQQRLPVCPSSGHQPECDGLTRPLSRPLTKGRKGSACPVLVVVGDSQSERSGRAFGRLLEPSFSIQRKLFPISSVALGSCLSCRGCRKARQWQPGSGTLRYWIPFWKGAKG